MKKFTYLIIILLSFLILEVQADDSLIRFEEAKINPEDISSIQRGAKTFAAQCMVCHTMNYMSYDPVAKAAGIIPTRMPKKNTKWWFGTPPPDLTLTASVHGADWVYTYLHAFYKDPSRPTGTNNLIVENTSMPDPFSGLRGEQVLSISKVDLALGNLIAVRKVPYYTALSLTRQGSMSSDQFDRMTLDLVNFLEYASDPNKGYRHKMGIGVLIFIAIFFLILYLLKRQYWRDVE